MNYKEVIDNIYNEVKPFFGKGHVADYIPALANIDPKQYGIAIANHGINPHNNESILTVSRSKRLSALMLTCGFYDESGEFAFRVGMPGKSGVGGGVVAIIPGKLSIAVWSPELNEHGNSYMGIETLERFTTNIGISIF